MWDCGGNCYSHVFFDIDQIRCIGDGTQAVRGFISLLYCSIAANNKNNTRPNQIPFHFLTTSLMLKGLTFCGRPVQPFAAASHQPGRSQSKRCPARYPCLVTGGGQHAYARLSSSNNHLVPHQELRVQDL